MKNINKRISILFVFIGLFFIGCDDEFEGDIVRDSRPAVPVTFTGSTSFGFNPYYTVSYAENNFSIVLSIPESSNVTIAEITNSVAGATSINVASLTAGTSIQYVPAPTAVGAKTFTLNTSITEFNTKVPAAARITAAPAAGVLVERAFMFRLTMSDGTTIVPVQCRIRVIP